MASTADTLRSHFKTLGANARVAAYDLRKLGSHSAVYKYLSREAQAGRIKRLAQGIYHVNLTSAPGKTENLEIMLIKARAFGKQVYPMEESTSKFRTNGCKSSLKVGSQILKWVPATIKKMREITSNKIPPALKEEKRESKFKSLSVTLLEEVEAPTKPQNTFFMQSHYVLQQIKHELNRIAMTLSFLTGQGSTSILWKEGFEVPIHLAPK